MAPFPHGTRENGPNQRVRNTGGRGPEAVKRHRSTLIRCKDKLSYLSLQGLERVTIIGQSEAGSMNSAARSQ